MTTPPEVRNKSAPGAGGRQDKAKDTGWLPDAPRRRHRLVKGRTFRRAARTASRRRGWRGRFGAGPSPPGSGYDTLNVLIPRWSVLLVQARQLHRTAVATAVAASDLGVAGDHCR